MGYVFRVDDGEIQKGEEGSHTNAVVMLNEFLVDYGGFESCTGHDLRD